MGSKECRGDSTEWDGVLGCHGLGWSGERMLNFCAANEFTIDHEYVVLEEHPSVANMKGT